MPATPSTATPTAGVDSTAGTPGSGRRRRRHGLRRPAARAGPPDLAALAREAVISFLNDTSGETATPETPGTAAPEPPLPAPAQSAGGASPASGVLATAAELGMMPADMISAAGPVTADSVAWRAAAVSVAALDRIEAAAAKVEADIAVALRAHAEMQAGAGAAAEAAVRAAQIAWVAAGTAMEADRSAKVTLRQVRHMAAITAVLVVLILVFFALTAPPLG